MGFWKDEPFTNETARNWIHELVEGDNLASIEITIDEVLNGGGRLDVTCHGREAVAAIEAIGLLLGNRNDFYCVPDNLTRWVKNNPQRPSVELIQKALRCAVLMVSRNSGSVTLDFRTGPDSNAWEAWRRIFLTTMCA